ncbi:DinB family protein [Kitasatospora atroaurantiaca]|uniref:Putative damage-inducible protein DinB n=1 Tax=Kitasatospora atroaurantiaca TaxID=285545 RepID=A0A561EJM8_9ACTN|nr:DinB family protein [Kitasatospora atroaurantiaca]TWE15782.1 putative damage-inducible protein DinB [Kitasatospora atroaurantiaca]
MGDQKRFGPPRVADERATLTGFLQRQRDTLAMACAGLTAEQLRERALRPSGLSLLGLLRHMADVERTWFRNVLNGENSNAHWPRSDGGAFDVDTADPAEAFEIWHEECARSRDIVDNAESLDVTGRYRDDVFSLRYILTHMIEEYARHNGQADLLREHIDGTAER